MPTTSHAMELHYYFRRFLRERPRQHSDEALHEWKELNVVSSWDVSCCNMKYKVVRYYFHYCEVMCAFSQHYICFWDLLFQLTVFGRYIGTSLDWCYINTNGNFHLRSRSDTGVTLKCSNCSKISVVCSKWFCPRFGSCSTYLVFLVKLNKAKKTLTR